MLEKHYNICNRRDMLSKRHDTLHSHEQNHGNVVSAKFVLLRIRREIEKQVKGAIKSESLFIL